TGTQGRTVWTRFAACSAMCRPPQLAQTARPLHDSGTRRSNAQSSQRTAKAMDEKSTPEEAAELAFDEAGQLTPSVRVAAAARKVSRCSRTTLCGTVSMAARGA